jgi:MFS family permease
LASFQIPSGILAARIGAKKTSIIGIAVLSLFNLFTAIPTSFSLLLIFRFVSGIGSAMFFSSGAAIVRTLIHQKKVGLGMGMYNASFNIGGGLAILLWPIIILKFGWQDALIIGSTIGLVMSVENLLVIPKAGNPIPFAYLAHVKKIIYNRNLFFLGASTGGFYGTWFTASSFLVPYLEIGRNLSPTASGIISSLFMLVGALGGIIGGTLTDRSGRRRRYIVMSMFLVAILVALIPFVPMYVLVFIPMLTGISAIILFSVMYVVPTDLDGVDPMQLPLSLGYLNSIQMGIAFPSSYLFTYVFHYYGFPYAWEVIALYDLIFMPLLLFSKFK